MQIFNVKSIIFEGAEEISALLDMMRAAEIYIGPYAIAGWSDERKQGVLDLIKKMDSLRDDRMYR